MKTIRKENLEKENKIFGKKPFVYKITIKKGF